MSIDLPCIGVPVIGTTRSSRPLLRQRDFLLLWIGQSISTAGTQVSNLAFPLLALAVTHSAAQAGLIVALHGLPFALLALPAGALIDRWDRKWVMIAADIGRAIAFASIPLVAMFGALSPVHLYAVSLLEGTFFTFFNLAEAAAMPRVVPREQLAEAIGRVQASDAVAALVGPSIGGVLYGLSRSLPFLADAASYLLSAISLRWMHIAFQEERATPAGTIRAEVAEGMRWLWTAPLVRFLAVLTCGLTVPCAGFALILIVLAQAHHASPATIGLIFAASGIGSAVGALIADPLQRRFGVRRVIVVDAWLWALTWLLYAISPNILILGLVNAATFVVVPVFMVVQSSYRLAVIPDALQGRVNSVFRLIAYGAQPLGLAVTGALLQVTGPLTTVLILAVPQVLMAAAATVNPHLRRAER